MWVQVLSRSAAQGFYLVHSNPRFPADPSKASYSGAAFACACTQPAMHGCPPRSHRRGRTQGSTTAPRPAPNAGPTMASRSAPALRDLRLFAASRLIPIRSVLLAPWQPRAARALATDTH